jgi:hypothetical protein
LTEAPGGGEWGRNEQDVGLGGGRKWRTMAGRLGEWGVGRRGEKGEWGRRGEWRRELMLLI